MSEIRTDIDAARRSLTDSINLISESRNEQVIRDSFTSYLRQIFPDQPSWMTRHIQGSESAVRIARGNRSTTGFVDNLVDLTVIEYESDLTVPNKFAEGKNQVKDYCASLLNDRHDPELIVGVLSDTVRWYAFQIDASQPTPEIWSRENIQLIQVEELDCSNVSDRIASDLTRF